MLMYSKAAASFVSEMGLELTTLEYEEDDENSYKFSNFFSKITFNEIKPFRTYQYAYFSEAYAGESKEFFNMIRYYENLRKSSLVKEYDFASNGNEAMNVLCEQMAQGVPVVLTLGDKAYNAVRLLQETGNPMKFIIEVYDSDAQGGLKKIKLEKVIVHDDGSEEPRVQYVAKINTEAERFCMYN